MAPGKTAPRLLQDLLTYDPRYEQLAGRNLLTSAPPQFNSNKPNAPAVPYKNCRHAFHTKYEQSQLPRAGEDPDKNTLYKIASYCSQCHWHVDLIVDYRDSENRKSQPCRNAEYLMHHFIFQGEDTSDSMDMLGADTRPRTYTFRCSAPRCPVVVTIHFKPPKFSPQDIETLTNQAQLRRRWDVAKEMAGDRADTTMARRVDGPDFLNTYLTDSLNPTRGKSQIPLLNRKFLRTFGRDCDSILKKFGFTQHEEEGEDGTFVTFWHLPKPEDIAKPLDSSLRNTIEDGRYELNTIILEMPESDRAGCKHQAMYPTPSRGDMERALACDDYEKQPGRVTRSNVSHEEDHPYYASLGAIADFSDPLLLFAFSQQMKSDLGNQPYYFECLKDLAQGRRSDMLETQVALLASNGVTTKRDLEAAYRYFDMDFAHERIITDENIIGRFKARIEDISPAQAEEARRQLRVLGDARNSQSIRAAANDTIETEEQALSWLDLDRSAGDEFVTAMFSIKTGENPACVETARKAVAVIAEARQSQRLREYLEKGSMTEPEMDVGEAYALFQVDNRTVALDLDVLKTTVDMADPGDVEKLQKAFAIIQQDQAQNHNNRMDGTVLPEARRNSYPLETWPVGLRNIGNTCYLNSVLQFLFTIAPLRNFILNCEDYMEDPSPEALKDKKVGRVAITADRVVVAQKFVRELRKFFERMVTAPTDTVQPDIDLASLALCRTDSPEEQHDTPASPISGNTSGSSGGLGTIDGVAVSGPTLPATLTPPDSVMGEDTEDSKSISSMQAMDLEGSNDVPAPPMRPPPVPPRPEAQAKANSEKTRIGILEESARQQDAAEVMGNIFDLISCAVKGEGVLREGEQQDTIKKLFFSDVTTVRHTTKGPEKLSELRHNYLVSPGWRDRHLYSTLDDDFGQNEMEDGTTRYEYIDVAAPILVINLRRIQWKNELVYDRSYISLDKELYLDRYLGKTSTLEELQLLKLREAQWEKQRQLRQIDAERKSLQQTEIQDMNLADSLEETSIFVNDLIASKPIRDENNGNADRSLPTPPPELAETLHDKAKHLKEELERMKTVINQLEVQVDTVFKNCRDHPYRLHAIFTHRGGVRGGHYWIYIYDFQNNIWRMYNDDHVTLVDEEQVFQREENKNYPKASTGVVYIRADLVDQLTQAVCREPTVEQTNEQLPNTPPQDVPMQDVAHNSNVKYNDLQVIEGVEMFAESGYDDRATTEIWLDSQQPYWLNPLTNEK